jgi:hypothetical protein
MQEEGGEEGGVSLNMSALVATMPKAMVVDDEDVLKEGEYETQFGRVVIEETDNGYKIVIYVNGKKLGQQMAKQLALSFVGPQVARERAV